MTLTPAKLRNIGERYAQAWCSHKPDAVAAFFAPTGRIAINGGAPSFGPAAIVDMANGLFTDVPDIVVRTDEIRFGSGNSAVLLWTFEGHHIRTRNFVKVSGWEEWTLTDDGLILASLGHYDATDYDRQIEGGR